MLKEEKKTKQEKRYVNSWDLTFCNINLIMEVGYHSCICIYIYMFQSDSFPLEDAFDTTEVVKEG